MTKHTEPFVYRQSVLSYLENPDVRHAVNLLLDRKIGYMPQTFSNGEMTDFYKACLAARQTQIEFVQDMADLWHRIWRKPNGDWTQVPQDPVDDELSLDPVIRWTEQYFQKDFEIKAKGQRDKPLRAKIWLWLASNKGDPSDVELGFEVVKGASAVLGKGVARDGWEWVAKHKHFSYQNPELQYADGLDLASLRKAAKSALELIEQL